MTADAPWSPRERTAAAAIAAAAVVLIFAGLGDNGLHTLDEARHALVAENIVRDGDWLLLTHEGVPYANKPPLKFWLTALTFRAFGADAFTARLWSALFGLGAVAATYLLGRRQFDRATGLVAALALATSSQFLYTHGARTGELDSALLCWFTLALALLTGARSRRDLVLGGAAAGLAGLTKHLAFTVEILAIWGLWAALAGPRRRPDRRGAGLAVLTAAAVALPWHVAAGLRFDGFWSLYLGREVLTRATAADVPAIPPAMYLLALKDGLYPWSWLAPAGVAGFLTGRERGRGAAWLLMVVWVGAVAFLIGASRVKFSWYALPLYPPLAVAAARAIVGPAAPGRAALLLAAGALAVVSTTDAWSFDPFSAPAMDGGFAVDLGGRVAALGPWWPAAWLASAAAAWPVWRRRLDGPRARAWTLALAAALALAYVAPPLRRAWTPTPLARFTAEARDLLPDDPAVAVWTPGGRALSDLERWSLRRMGVEVKPEAAWTVVCPELSYELPAARPATPRPAGRVLLERGGYELLAPPIPSNVAKP